jgi:DNA-3-methyladenine glycosylase
MAPAGRVAEGRRVEGRGADGRAAVGGVVVSKRLAPRARGGLPVEFYARPVLEVARELIGCVVEHGGLSGRIVETEAYHESEPACHAFVGLTPRTSTLFGEPGTAYVYRSYGIHALLNAVCEPAGVGAAVLIRALEPLVGVEEMRERRASGQRGRGRLRDRDLCSGPGKLTQALGIELSENGASLLDGPVRIRAARGDELGEGASAPYPSLVRPTVAVGPRIGITKAVDLRWRFCLAGSPHVSRPVPRVVAGEAGPARRLAKSLTRSG